jgi:ABC-type phosphate transport system auxiliary subunit
MFNQAITVIQNQLHHLEIQPFRAQIPNLLKKLKYSSQGSTENFVITKMFNQAITVIQNQLHHLEIQSFRAQISNLLNFFEV